MMTTIYETLTFARSAPGKPLLYNGARDGDPTRAALDRAEEAA